MIRKEVMKQQ